MSGSSPTLFSSKQILSLIESTARINIWQGAVRSGKTYISIWRFIEELANGPDGQYALITRTYDSFKRNILPLIVQIIGGSVRHYSGKRELHILDKVVHIIGADDERAESKIRGSTFSGAYVDELTIIPETVFKMLLSRCAMKDAKIFATTNPDSPFHWLKRDFLDTNPDVKTWLFTLNDNPALTRDEKEYLRRQYKGLWYQRFIEGLWVQAEGSVYDFFDEKVHLIDYKSQSARAYIVGIDYGTTNPCAFVMVGVDVDHYPNMWVEKEYYFDSKLKQRQKTDSEYGEDFRRFVEGYHVSAIYIDPSAVSFRHELRKVGVENVREANNKVLDGIRFVGQLIEGGTLKICRNNVNLIREIQSYVWDVKSYKKGIDQPLKENDHALDALRYALFTHFFDKNHPNVDWQKVRREVFNGGDELPSPFNEGGYHHTPRLII